MKKLFSIFLLSLFALSLAFSITNELTKDSKVNSKSTYASILPIPPPEPPPRKGC